MKSETEHLKTNKKDYQAIRGLLAFVTKRKRLLNYLKKKDSERFNKVVAELKIRKV